MAKQDLLYNIMCVLVYVCVVVSDYACMSACACVSWQRKNYLNIVSREIPNSACTVFSVIPRLVNLLQQQNCLTSLLKEGGEGWDIRKEKGRGEREGGEKEREGRRRGRGGKGSERLICIATIRVKV